MASRESDPEEDAPAVNAALAERVYHDWCSFTSAKMERLEKVHRYIGKLCAVEAELAKSLTRLSERFAADAVVLASGGYTNVYYLSTNAMGSNVTATLRAHKRGALFANPCYTQIHPTCIPASDEFQSKLTLMSESLRNDGRIWVPKGIGDNRPADQIPED